MQLLSELTNNLNVEVHGEAFATQVSAVVEHSGCVITNSIFVARNGHRRDGSAFIDDAIEKGANCIVCTPDVADSIKHKNIALVVTCDPIMIGATLAERFHGNPSSKLKLIGVTGTNGKTTVSYLIRHILRSCSIPCGMLGTIVCDDGQSSSAAKLTTPSFCDNSRLLRGMVDNNCVAAVMECSSHALDQGRVAALDFDTGIFTNFSGDHLDYHGSSLAYLQAKLKLFKNVRRCAVINMDDPASWSVANRCNVPVMSCRIESDSASAWVEVIEETISGLDVILHGDWGEIRTHIPLVGRHNAINALQATVIADQLGASPKAIGAALSTAISPPGRLERVQDDAIPVFVDFAHTDDALKKMLESVRHILPEGGKLHVVFGCGGDRDRSKRPRMGQTASIIGDIVYATSDNPRSENPETILDEVLSGVPADRRSRVHRIANRKEAIETAIGNARECDVVIIAGKGHEKNQILRDRTIPFDDVLVAKEAIQTRARNQTL